MQHVFTFVGMLAFSAFCHEVLVQDLGLGVLILIVFAQSSWIYSICESARHAHKLLQKLVLRGLVWVAVSAALAISPFWEIWWLVLLVDAAFIPMVYQALSADVRIALPLYGIGVAIWLVSVPLGGFLRYPLENLNLLAMTGEGSSFFGQISTVWDRCERVGRQSGYYVALLLFAVNLPILNIFRFGTKT